MALKIRLKRIGKKKNPFYRVVVQDEDVATRGIVLEEVGTYDPMKEPPIVQLKAENIKKWLGQGAQPSDTVAALLRKANVQPSKIA